MASAGRIRRALVPSSASSGEITAARSSLGIIVNMRTSDAERYGRSAGNTRSEDAPSEMAQLRPSSSALFRPRLSCSRAVAFSSSATKSARWLGLTTPICSTASTSRRVASTWFSIARVSTSRSLELRNGESRLLVSSRSLTGTIAKTVIDVWPLHALGSNPLPLPRRDAEGFGRRGVRTPGGSGVESRGFLVLLLLVLDSRALPTLSRRTKERNSALFSRQLRTEVQHLLRQAFPVGLVAHDRVRCQRAHPERGDPGLLFPVEPVHDESVDHPLVHPSNA